MQQLQRLKTLDSHFCTLPPPTFPPKTNMLEKYRGMSEVDAKYLYRSCVYEVNTDLTLQFEQIIRDNKLLFEQ